MLIFLQRVWALAYPYRMRLFLGVVCGVLAGVMAPLLMVAIWLVSTLIFEPAGGGDKQQLIRLPTFIQPWLDNVRTGMGSGLREHFLPVFLLVMTIPLAMLLAKVMGYLNTYFLQWAAIRTVTDLRTKLFNHLLGLSAGFFNKTSSGELISRVMNDTGVLQQIVSGATSVIVRDPVTLIGTLSVLLWRQPMMTLISMISLPICMVPIVIYNRKIRQASRGMQNQSAGIMQVMSESFSGYRVIKAYNLEDVVTKEFRRSAGQNISNYMRIIRASEITSPMIDFFAAFGVALALLYMVYLAKTNPNPGDFILFAGSIFSMYGPMKNLTRLHNQITQARAASERVFELLATKNSVPEPDQPKKLHAAQADIVFNDVHFAYGEKNRPARHQSHRQIRPARCACGCQRFRQDYLVQSAAAILRSRQGQHHHRRRGSP
ncbi:MAG: ABC transporter transmembrane domain-containing protein [Limisphaerales bacterium]